MTRLIKKTYTTSFPYLHLDHIPYYHWLTHILTPIQTLPWQVWYHIHPSIPILFPPLPFIFIHYFTTYHVSHSNIIFTCKVHQKLGRFWPSRSSSTQRCLKSICSKSHSISTSISFIVNQIWWKYPYFQHVEHTVYYNTISWGIHIAAFLSGVFGILSSMISLSPIYNRWCNYCKYGLGKVHSPYEYDDLVLSKINPTDNK